MSFNLFKAIPGVNTAYDFGTGDWKGGLANLGTGGLYGTYDQGKSGLNDLKNAYNAPFNEKRQGYDAVSAMAGDVKNQRIARQQATLGAVESKLDPQRRAIQAMYGDPSSWKL
jgi:hypothetical protein